MFKPFVYIDSTNHEIIHDVIQRCILYLGWRCPRSFSIMSLFKPLNDFFSDIPVMADFRIPGTNKVISFDRHAANNVSMFAFRVTSNVGTDAQLETVCGGAFKSDHLLLAVGDKQPDGSLRSTAYIGDQEVTHIMPPEQVAAVEALKEQRRLKRLQNHDRARTRLENA